MNGRRGAVVLYPLPPAIFLPIRQLCWVRSRPARTNRQPSLFPGHRSGIAERAWPMMLLGYICQQAVQGCVQASLILRDNEQILASCATIGLTISVCVPGASIVIRQPLTSRTANRRGRTVIAFDASATVTSPNLPGWRSPTHVPVALIRVRWHDFQTRAPACHPLLSRAWRSTR